MSDELPVDDIPLDPPVEEIPTEDSPVENNWDVEITVLAKNVNQITPISNIASENKIVVRNVVSDSELLRILNFIQPINTI